MGFFLRSTPPPAEEAQPGEGGEEQRQRGWRRSGVALELERQLEPDAEGGDLAVLDVDILIDDLGDAQVAQGLSGPLDGGDLSFVRNVTDDPANAAITKTIIALAKNLNLGVIAEGVETAEQFAFLRHHGCEEVQGYYISRPLPADQFTVWYGERLQSRVREG